VVLNYLNDDNSVKDDFDIWQDYFNTGNTFNHNQKLTANYELPINKIPFLSFIKSSYVFDSNFNWQQAATSLSDVEIEGVSYNLGNTIQNSQSNSLNTTLNMEMFYKYVGLTGKNTKKKTKATPPKPGEKIVKKDNNNPVKTNSFVDGLKGVLTAVKNIQINYTDNRGTVLPGYLPGVGFWGTTKPSLGFIFGSQNDIRYEAAKNGYLTNYQDFNQNFTQVSTQILKATAKVTPLTDFQIDVTADRSYSSNYSEQYDVSSDGFYNSRSPYSTGQFSVSAFLLKTAFSQSDENSSDAFDAFRNNRLVVAQRLATQRGDDLSIVDAEGFPIHFNKNNQDVLLPSFLAAYTGADASTSELGIFRNFPMPNWTARYTGLMKLESFKKKFKRFSLQHGYRASYTVNEFRSNLNYTNEVDGDLDDETQRNISKTLISNINLVEQFNPLMKIDFELKNSFRFLTEFKRDRALSLSFDNNLLTEVKGFEYSMGFGYRIKDVRMTSSLADNPTGLLKGDVNLKADFSYRNNKTIVRYLDYDNNQLAAGQNIWTFKLTADYSFSKYLTAIFYYDHSFSSAVISTTFPLTNIRSGFTIRYTFGN
jgi:cell surface protein SprA